jgi:hypothetical protein
MSNSTAIALLIASFATIFFCFSYATKNANELATEIVTGVVRGVPLSTQYRYMMLYNHWAGYAVASIFSLVVGTFMNVLIAANVADEDVKALAYVVAFVTAVGAIWWVFSAILEIVQYRSVVRQAEAD